MVAPRPFADIGVVDLMIGFPSAEAARTYDYLSSQIRGRSAETAQFPAGYMFKDVPNRLEEGQDPVDVTLAEMDRHGVAVGLVPLGRKVTRRALADHPDRFRACLEVDPNDITATVRSIRSAHDEHDIAAVSTFPAGCNPQVPVSDRRYYPIYQTCIDLDVPIIVNAGIAGPRVPVGVPGRHALRPGLLRLPRAAHRDAPRRGAVGGPGRQAHAQVAGPPLHDERLRPPLLPEGHRRLREHPRRDKVMYAGYFPWGLSLERIFTELPDVPFRDHVWPKFLRENAVRVFKLEP